jgi:hypothetical protein
MPRAERRAVANEKVYIHEFIDIIGANRANYMHHMTANWSPLAQRQRHQLCYGVWGTVGSTQRWPQVVNIWEEDGFAGLARSFRGELNHPTLQDPALAAWWQRAAEFRRGGIDRLLVPAPWTRTIEELCADGVTGEVYAHERGTAPAGTAWDVLEVVRSEGVPVYGRFNWVLAGAWVTAMVDDDEAFLLWAVPTWNDWAAFESADRVDDEVMAWTRRRRTLTTSWERFLLVDAPLCPFRTGRQPAESDQASYTLPD